MTDSKQLDILKRLTNHIAGITLANGYDFDLTGSVFRGIVFFGEDKPRPLVSITEAPKPDVAIENVGYTNETRIEDWPILIQGIVEDDKDNPTDPAYQLKAAVELRLSEIIAVSAGDRPLHPEVYLFGRGGDGKTRATEVFIGPGIVSPAREQISSSAFFFLPVLIRHVVDITKPFST